MKYQVIILGLTEQDYKNRHAEFFTGRSKANAKRYIARKVPQGAEIQIWLYDGKGHSDSFIFDAAKAYRLFC